MTFHFVPFAVVGDPSYEDSIAVVRAYVDSGATMLELGFPFSDPVADGPVIQAADRRALAYGMTTERAFDFLAEVREFTALPINLLLYYNLVFKYGVDAFFARAKKVGVTSVLIADLPVDCARGQETLALAKAHGVRMVYMVSELTPPERLSFILEADPYFLYVVSRPGVTGVRSDLNGSFAPDGAVVGLIARLKKTTAVPILIGFGISERTHADAVRVLGADGVIVGSALVGAYQSSGFEELVRCMMEFNPSLTQ